MKKLLPFILSIFFGCSAPKTIHKAVHDGIEIAYHWDHDENEPSELVMRMDNKTLEDRRISLVIDIYLNGKTVETLQADTCIRLGQSLNGKLNGIYFVPENVSPAQIKSGEVQIEMTRTFVEPLPCE